MHRLKTLVCALALVLLMAGAAFGQPSTGTANFTSYVAFGDSLTAGYSSSALVRTYQVNSYPALIYRQATGKTTGFEQPLISAPGISGLAVCNGPTPPAPCGILRLTVVNGSLSPVPTPGRGVPVNLNLQRPYNNLGVPGQTLHDLLNQTSGGFADVVLRGLGTQIQEGLALHPTFATVWIGNNDVLGAAASGIAIGGVTLTPVEQFQADYTALVNAISAAGAKMAIANIPDVTSIPFVTTIPRVIFNPQTLQPILVNGQTIPLIGPNGPLQPGDFVLLTASAELSQGRGIPVALGGSGLPLTDDVVLSKAEVSTINDYVIAYNQIIAKAASDKGAALVDVNTQLKNLAANGIAIGGITFTSKFLTGGVFSYDGVHPTAFGYAYIANLFIDAINRQFGGAIPEVDLYPFVFGPLPAASSAAAAGKAAENPFTSFVFSEEARRSLLQVLSAPQWVIDGTKPPRKPRHNHG